MRKTVFFFSFLLFVQSAAAARQELTLPVVVNGDIQSSVHFETVIQILNPSGSRVEVVLQSFKNDGSPAEIFGVSPKQSQISVTVEAGGAERVMTKWPGSSPANNGWVRLVYDDSATLKATAEVAVIINPDWIGSRDVFTSAQVPAVKPLKEFRAVANGAIWGETLQYLSAYAFVNPSDTNTASVRLSLINWHAPGVDFSRPIAEKLLQIPPPLPRWAGSRFCAGPNASKLAHSMT